VYVRRDADRLCREKKLWRWDVSKEGDTSPCVRRIRINECPSMQEKHPKQTVSNTPWCLLTNPGQYDFWRAGDILELSVVLRTQMTVQIHFLLNLSLGFLIN
jgi:hypothetical protein